MRCIFCKIDTSRSRSIEHIIPESLGNTNLTLPVGVVCDKCNNYFSRKVEKPFLESKSILALRFHQELVSKKGRVPVAVGQLDNGMQLTLSRDSETGISYGILSAEVFDHVNNHGVNNITLPYYSLPNGDTTSSRFVAKVGYEAMALRLVRDKKLLNGLIDDQNLDAIRKYVRRDPNIEWPIFVRQIYDVSQKWKTGDYESGQIVHESDFLKLTKMSSILFCAYLELSSA